jgi:hypothetical protein
VTSSQERPSIGSANIPFSPNHGFQPGKPGGGALKFTIAELNKITGNFSESHKIGQGGFGTVYQGKLRDGTTVAIKRAKKVILAEELNKTVDFRFLSKAELIVIVL